MVITPVRGQKQLIRPYACIHRGCRFDHSTGPQNWLLALRPGGCGRLCCDQPGGDVGGEGSQLRAGSRRQRLAHPQVELVLGQHALHECGLEGVDHLLAVGMRGPQVTAASCLCCYLVSRSCHHRHLPASTIHAKPNAVARGSAAPRPSDPWKRAKTFRSVETCIGVRTRSEPGPGPGKATNADRHADRRTHSCRRHSLSWPCMDPYERRSTTRRDGFRGALTEFRRAGRSTASTVSVARSHRISMFRAAGAAPPDCRL